MSTDNSVERLLASYEAQTFSTLSELQRKLIAAMDQRETLGDIHLLNKPPTPT